MNQVENLKISVITPSYNQASFIEETICSVISQNIPNINIEHIVIDGGSTDNTVDVLKKYPHVIWVSEKDNGQADALNKGFEIATGDIIGWVNSDDYFEKDIFSNVLKCFGNPEIMWVVGNLTYLYDQFNEKISDKSQPVTFDSLVHNPDIVRQQSTFFRKKFIERAGRWDEKFHMVMDYDLWIRLSKISTPTMIDENWAYFRFHGDQKTSLPNLLLQKREMTEILKRESVSPWLILKHRCKKRWHWTKASIKLLLISVGILSSKYQQRPLRVNAGDK